MNALLFTKMSVRNPHLGILLIKDKILLLHVLRYLTQKKVEGQYIFLFCILIFDNQKID